MAFVILSSVICHTSRDNAFSKSKLSLCPFVPFVSQRIRYRQTMGLS